MQDVEQRTEILNKKREQVISTAAIWHVVAGSTKATFILAEFHSAAWIPGSRLVEKVTAYMAYWGWMERACDECDRYDQPKHILYFVLNKCLFSSYFGFFFQTFHCSLIRVCGHSSCLTPQAGDIFQNVSQLSLVSIRHPMLLECPIGYLRCCRPSPFHHNTTPVSHGITSQTLHACVCVCVCCSVTE